MKRSRPSSTKDLLPSERTLLNAIREIGFGQIEFLRVRAGEPVLDPWPVTVRDLKFGTGRYEPVSTRGADFDLKGEAVDLFEYTREVEDGEIRCLAVRHGLPFSMEIELPGGRLRGSSGGRRE